MVKRSLVPVTQVLRPLRERISPLRDTPLTYGEVMFARSLPSDLRVVIDAGARIDVFYADLFRECNVTVVLVEPHPRFAAELRRRTSKHDPIKVIVLQVAVGEFAGFATYFTDGQSLLSTSNVGRQHRGRLKDQIRIVTVDALASSYGPVDFLKTDLEEFDYFALLGAKDALSKTIRFVQFELGIGALHKERKVANADYWNLLEPYFDLFLVGDHNNPYWANTSRPPLVTLNKTAKAEVETLQLTGVGFNVAAIRKDSWNSALRALTEEA